jgi:NAD(P)H-hydrate epimerase
VAVLSGPGNNGGDGFVAARHLVDHGFSVRLALLGDPAKLKGDAAEMARHWTGGVEEFSADILDGADVVIDAIFGAGLTRNIDGIVQDMIKEIGARFLPVVAVDVPSGIDGTTGEVRGIAPHAAATVTFFRRKPGHLLLPGRLFRGPVRVAQIGINDSVLADVAPTIRANAPALWLSRYPWPQLGGHKYSRGHAVVVSGDEESTGAARLGATAALRVGAGLVTLVGSKAATAVNASHLTAVMVQSIQGARGLSKMLSDERKNAVLIGPGAGVGEKTRKLVKAALKSPAACVLDADALTSFENTPKSLFRAIAGCSAPVVLTPHEGEFARLFAAIPESDSKPERARKAASLSGAHVLLKGADSVAATPEGQAFINENAPATLATAGSGDVLAGIIAGLLAQRMETADAVNAAMWLHGEAAAAFGPGLIAEDLPLRLPAVLDNLADRAGL